MRLLSVAGGYISTMALKGCGDLVDGRYELGTTIGRGAMGVVRRAHDLRLDRTVAIKLVRADLAADRDVRSRFKDEARAAAGLAHPSIVTVFDSGDWNGIPYLIMECLTGRTLADELAGGPLPDDRVRAVGLAMGNALAAAHGVGVIHRDVKPGNILLTETGGVKLADFGIAKSTEAVTHTMTGLILGTPIYMAPERLDGEVATAQTDIYSLGVVLYEALTGEKPFRGDTPVALAHDIRTTTPVPIGLRLPHCDAALGAAIDRAMARDPADRPASAYELAVALDGGLALTRVEQTQYLPTTDTAATAELVATPEPASASPIYQTVEAVGRSRSHRRPGRTVTVVGGVAFIVALIALIGAFWVRPSDEAAEPRTVTPTPTSLPVGLEDALRELEESVQP